MISGSRVPGRWPATEPTRRSSTSPCPMKPSLAPTRLWATFGCASAVDAQTVAGGVQAVGSMAIDAHDFGIRLPGEGDPIVVDSHLTLEFLLVLEHVDHQTGAN